MSRLAEITILVVNEDTYLRRATFQMLRSVGAKAVILARSASEGLQMVAQVRPDVALIEMEMSTTDGVSLIRKIRVDPDSPNPFLPIVGTMTRPNRGLVEAARDAGVHEFLARPHSAEHLIRHIEAAIETERAFVRAPDYFGPDRRRRERDEYRGPERRRPDELQPRPKKVQIRDIRGRPAIVHETEEPPAAPATDAADTSDPRKR